LLCVCVCVCSTHTQTHHRQHFVIDTGRSDACACRRCSHRQALMRISAAWARRIHTSLHVACLTLWRRGSAGGYTSAGAQARVAGHSRHLSYNLTCLRCALRLHPCWASMTIPPLWTCDAQLVRVMWAAGGQRWKGWCAMCLSLRCTTMACRLAAFVRDAGVPRRSGGAQAQAAQARSGGRQASAHVCQEHTHALAR
jgi:hypothetical protein